MKSIAEGKFFVDQCEDSIGNQGRQNYSFLTFWQIIRIFPEFQIIYNFIKFYCFLYIYAPFEMQYKLIIVKFPEFL